ncbi:MAG: type II toxin-antitoxin system RelE/ParE family toxin [Pontiellaceae bacterium]|nr:type II toxin-antitoxin system RelE/ParE family toxin [Pontiellaceae bacterium]
MVIRPEAEAELAEAFSWYEDQVPGLGAEFLNVVDAALAGIVRNPNGFPVVHKCVRRCLTRRFPYAVFYLLEPGRIVVLSVFHVRRHPKGWEK